MAQSATVKQIPYTWEGTDRAGKKVRGKSIAHNEASLRAELRRQGVVLSRARKQSQLFQRKGKVTSADIAIFSRQMATMMSAGIPLVQSFDIIGAGHENPAMQKLILSIKADVEGGTATIDLRITTEYGLGIMQERASEIGAHLRIDSQPCHGTQVSLSLPLEVLRPVA
jgi:hypothetical protein